MGDRTTLDRISLQISATHELNLKHLYYFHAVATSGTIAAAARRLKLSNATISEQLKQLEEHLGHTLMERRRTGVRLNQTGRKLLAHTTTMFRVVDRMLQDVAPASAPASSATGYRRTPSGSPWTGSKPGERPLES